MPAGGGGAGGGAGGDRKGAGGAAWARQGRGGASRGPGGGRRRQGVRTAGRRRPAAGRIAATGADGMVKAARIDPRGAPGRAGGTFPHLARRLVQAAQDCDRRDAGIGCRAAAPASHGARRVACGNPARQETQVRSRLRRGAPLRQGRRRPAPGLGGVPHASGRPAHCTAGRPACPAATARERGLGQVLCATEDIHWQSAAARTLEPPSLAIVGSMLASTTGAALDI